MIVLALITVATATEPVDNAQLDSLIQAKPAGEMTVAGPALPDATAGTETAATAVEEATVSEAAVPTTTTPTESITTEKSPTEESSATKDAAITEEVGTPIDWESAGSSAVVSGSTDSGQSSAGLSVVMLPLALGFIGLMLFFRKRVFNQLPGTASVDPMTIVARKATGNQSAIFLIDVTDLEGGTRRLLVGSSSNGNSLLADVSPSHSIFPEPVFEDEPSFSVDETPLPRATAKSDRTPPALRAVEARNESPESLLDFGPKRALIDELISSSEKSSFRPRSVKQAYSGSASVSSDPNSEEKRRAAQAVLDEVLAERRAGHRGTKVRVTA